MNLELSQAELQVVRNALLREQNLAWAKRSAAYWKKVYELAERVIARIDGRELPLPGGTPSVSPAGSAHPGSQPAGDAGLLTRGCDACGAPLRTDEEVPLCPPCRTKLRRVLADTLGLPKEDPCPTT